MKRNKRFLALSLATVMGLSTISVPAETVKAEEVSQEYVVMAKNDTGYEQVEAVYGDEMTEESVAFTGYALQNLQMGEFSDGFEVEQAIDDVCDGTTPKFRIVNIKKNIEANGYTVYKIVKKVNADSSKVKDL